MNDLNVGFSVARAPLQQRGQARFEVVLDTARSLLKEEGFAGFSIPALAERLGFTRASIYNFFPTPYAVLNELAKRELVALEQRLVQRASATAPVPWKEQIRRTIHEAVGFYNDNPVARLLILGGSLTDESYHAQALTIRHLGSMSQRMFAEGGIAMPQQPVDVMVLAVDLGTTCFRHSVLVHGLITPAYENEAAQVMARYLTPYVRQAMSEKIRETAERRD